MPQPQLTRRGTPYLERILLYGDGGSGKSRKVLDVAKWFLKREQTPTFHWMSSDNGLQGFWVPGSGYDECEDLVEEWVVRANDWGSWIDAIRGIEKATKGNPSVKDWPDDELGDIPWLVVDLARDAWLAAQNAHVDKVAGMDATDYWLKQAKDTKSSNSGWAIFEDLNYTVINRLYAELANMIIQFPGHVVVITGEDLVKQDKQGNVLEQDRQIGSWFGREGYKPKGQKDLAHQLRTIVRCKAPQRANGPWTWTRLKDLPARQEIEVGKTGNGGEAGDFFTQYLMKCGWRL